jgi:hypothetical protein
MHRIDEVDFDHGDQDGAMSFEDYVADARSRQQLLRDDAIRRVNELFDRADLRLEADLETMRRDLYGILQH